MPLRRLALVVAVVLMALAVAPHAPCADNTLELRSAELPAISQLGGRSVQATIWFQGFLSDEATGEPVDATHTVTARIYDAEVGGVSVWGPESHVGTVVSAGWFSIELGSIAPPLPAFDAPPYYLEIWIGGEMLEPRLKLASVPSALQSGSADDGFELPYEGEHHSSGVAFRVTHYSTGICGHFVINSPGNSAAALYGSSNGTGPGVLGWADGSGSGVKGVSNGVGPAVRGEANADGLAGQFDGSAEVLGEFHVTETALFDSAVLANRLLAGQEFAFMEGAAEGYVLTCDDSWGSASWQPLPEYRVPIIDRHSEDIAEVIGPTWGQYDDAQVTLTVPGPGYISVDASLWVKLNHTEGQKDKLQVAISEFPDDIPMDFTAINSFEIPSSWPSAGVVGTTLHPHHMFRVTTSGTYSYYLVGEMSNGQDTFDYFWYAHMRGIYFPDPPAGASPSGQGSGPPRSEFRP